MSGTLWIGLCLFLGVLILELVAPDKLTEGFQTIIPSTEPVKPARRQENALSALVQARMDVGPGREQKGYIQDKRYFSGYVDVQRFGMKKDFCRMISSGDEKDTFFACALAGTKTSSPYAFRTVSVREGLRLSRDDYMRDIIKDGRDAYCRILKFTDSTYQPLCLRALDTRFHRREEIDPDPPEDVKTLLDFYSGCQMWLRLRDDLLDYVDNAVLQYAGSLAIQQVPNPSVTRGLYFNGIDQFVRLGDTEDLVLGNKIKMRTVRAFSLWVYFDEFTNNAHIFDFGDGPGRNNVFLGILGKGEAGDEPAELRPGPKCPETTVPRAPVGAQWVPEMTPQELLETTAANVDEYICDDFEVQARRLDPSSTRRPLPTGPATRATLLFEIWDTRFRKVQIKVNRAVPLKAWTHIVVTAANMDAMRPDLQVWINGNIVFVQESGYLPQAKTTSHNYLGKSNWANAESEYELRDELFKGSLFDFRMYNTNLSETKIKRTLQWGMEKLGLNSSFLTADATPSKGIQSPRSPNDMWS